MTKVFQKLNLSMTPIVSYGLVVLLLLLTWFGVERLDQIRRNFGEDAGSLRMRLSVVENIKSQNQWADRLAYSISVKDQVDSSIWRGRTSGVIAAELQQFLRKIAVDNTIINANIRVDPEPSDIDGLKVLMFDLNGSVTTAAGGIDILEHLSKYEKQIILSDVNISNDTRDRRPSRVLVSGFIPIELLTSSDNETQ